MTDLANLLVSEMHKRIVEFTFMKKNGEKRIAHGTLNPEFSEQFQNFRVLGTGKPTPPTNIFYWDMDKDAPRSLIIANLVEVA